MSKHEVKKIRKKVNVQSLTHTPLPQWYSASWTGYPTLKKSYRKIYLQAAGWIVVLGFAIAVGAKISSCFMSEQQSKEGDNVSQSLTLIPQSKTIP